MRQKSLLLQAFSSKPLFNPRSTYVDRTLIQEILEIVEQAAIASATLSGKGLKDEADALAVDAMRKRMNQIQMQGRIVIGEGERDEAPMLYIGEEVGTGTGPGVDFAVDPCEGTNLCAYIGVRRNGATGEIKGIGVAVVFLKFCQIEASKRLGKLHRLFDGPMQRRNGNWKLGMLLFSVIEPLLPMGAAMPALIDGDAAVRRQIIE